MNPHSIKARSVATSLALAMSAMLTAPSAQAVVDASSCSASPAPGPAFPSACPPSNKSFVIWPRVAPFPLAT